MGYVSDNYRVFATIAGIMGIIQGVIWLALTTFAIVSYYECDIFEENSSVFSMFWGYVQRAYFLGPTCSNSLHDRFETLNLHVIRPHELLVWTNIYFVLSVIWIISSGLLIIGVNLRKVNVALIIYSFLWIFLTLGISCMDIAFGCLFGLDYSTFAERYDIRNENTHAYLFLSGGSFALMTISLRGFVLVPINLSFVVYLFVQSFGLQRDNNNLKHNIHTQGPLRAYDSNMRENNSWNSREFVGESMHRSRDGHTNNAFVIAPEETSSNDNNERSLSWHEVKLTQQRPKIQHEPLKDPDNSVRNQNQFLQSTDALSPRTFAPYTPTPDYSPPAVRQIRLKPTLKHHYLR